MPTGACHHTQQQLDLSRSDHPPTIMVHVCQFHLLQSLYLLFSIIPITGRGYLHLRSRTNSHHGWTLLPCCYSPNIPLTDHSHSSYTCIPRVQHIHVLATDIGLVWNYPPCPVCWPGHPSLTIFTSWLDLTTMLL